MASCKRGSMLSYVCAVVLTDGSVPWWALPAAAAVALLGLSVSRLGAALEGAQRTRFLALRHN